MTTIKVTKVKAGFRATVRGLSGEAQATSDNKTRAICDALQSAVASGILTQAEREHFLIYGRWPSPPRPARAADS